MGGMRLGRIMGIEVRVHASWIVIAALVLWTLVSGALPADFADVHPAIRLIMAVAITGLFFLSLLAHELAHSVVAVTRGIPVRRITFFLFGGMAETTRDSRSPGEEFLIAIAGPLCSLLIAGLSLMVWLAGTRAGWPAPVTGAAVYIGFLNAILAVFNLLPGYPMDGGRVLRAAIWKATGSVGKATRWASRVGVWMAYGLMLYGAWEALTVDFMGGLWLVLIAMFIRNAAVSGYRQHVLGRFQEAARDWVAAAQQTTPPGLSGRDVTNLRPTPP